MRSAQAIARRAFALALFNWRSSFELDWHNEPPEERRALLRAAAEMRFLLIDTGLELALSVGERELLGRKPGNWPSQTVTDSSWCGENLLALLWTLGRAELPPVWEISPDAFDFAVEDPEGWEEWISGATIRAESEIVRMADYIESIRLRGKSPDDFEGVSGLALRATEFVGEPPLEGDLPIDGKPFRTLDAEARNTVRSIAMERHKALTWVLGNEDDLDAPAPKV